MPVRRILRLVFPLVSVICLGIGYAPAGPWITGLAVVFILLAWVFAALWPSGFLPTGALVLSVILAAAGSLSGAGALWMLLEAAFALAGWDVLIWNHATTRDLLSARWTLAETRHYQALAAVLGLGLMAVAAGRLFRFQISFGWMVVLVILVLFSLERIRHTLIG